MQRYCERRRFIINVPVIIHNTNPYSANDVTVYLCNIANIILALPKVG